MFRASMIPAMVLVAFCLSIPGEASDTCSRASPGKCKVSQTAPPKKGNTGAVIKKKTQAPAKGNHKGRNEYTAEQRQKMMERAREICRKEHGAPSRVYRIDYKKNQVWCVPPAY